MKKLSVKFIAAALTAVIVFTGCSRKTVTETATAQGFGGEVSVSITAKDGKFESAKITGDKETATIGGQAVKTIEDAMNSAKSIDVDGVAGATVTSNAVRKAAKEAWSMITGEPVSYDVKMAPGSYTASSQGFRAAYDIEVTVTVDETSILSVEVNPDSADTVGIFQNAAELMPERIVANQSVATDAVCGATVSSNAIKSAARKAIIMAMEAAGGDTEAIAAFETSTPKNDGIVELETDVLVVGIGAAGTTAALSAAETMYAQDPDNVSVLAIDKAGRYGGASSLCAGVFAVNPERIQEEWNEGNNYADRDKFLGEWTTYTLGDQKTEMVELVIDESGKTLDWLHYEYGLELEQPKGGLVEGESNVVLFSYAPASKGMTVRRQHNIIFYDNCMTQFQNMGGKVMLETEAYELIVEDGVVTGVKARNTYDGTEYIIHAKEVISCTGGFLANGEMTTKYLSNEYYPLSGEWEIVGMKQNDGALIESAINNGAATYNIGMCPCVHIIGSAGYLQTFEYHTIEGKLCMQTMKDTKWTEGDLPHYMGVSPDSLAVNTKGERITNEAKKLNFDTWMSGPNFYSIWSDDQIKDIETNGLRTDPAYMMTVNLGACGWAPTGTPITNAHEVMEAAIEAGFVFKADTVEELGEMLGMDGAVLKATVDKYNEACATGVDEEFGKDASMLYALSGDGPFYAIKMASIPYSTCGALDVNENLEVLKTDGTVYEGLYACGLDSSGVLYSEAKPYVTYGGVDQGFAFTSGRLAGAHAAAKCMAE